MAPFKAQKAVDKLFSSMKQRASKSLSAAVKKAPQVTRYASDTSKPWFNRVQDTNIAKVGVTQQLPLIMGGGTYLLSDEENQVERLAGAGMMFGAGMALRYGIGKMPYPFVKSQKIKGINRMAESESLMFSALGRRKPMVEGIGLASSSKTVSEYARSPGKQVIDGIRKTSGTRALKVATGQEMKENIIRRNFNSTGKQTIREAEDFLPVGHPHNPSANENVIDTMFKRGK